ncbi:hypothetical protein WSM22_13840 [Cytophagales bacterium WSM2-2]|nr:hypothetical protein WSM22_13840 [Cytophagales bacterium WSM2-2]
MTFLYNVTFGIDKEIEQEWFAWIKQYYLPKAMESGAFTTYKIYKVLTHEDEGSISYSIQYFSDSIEKIVHYLNNDGKVLVEEHRQRFKDRHVAFNTLLQES